MEERILNIVEKKLSTFRSNQIKATLNLLEDGNTVPFIARYRKERTHSLDEVQIREIQSVYHQTETLEKRKDDVLKNIEEQQKLTPELAQKIKDAEVLQTVEDLYLPFKQKRRTKATIAKEAGLEPLAAWVLSFPQGDLKLKLESGINVDKDVNTIDDVLAGVHEILAEAFSDQADIREWIRSYTKKNGFLKTDIKSKGKELDENEVYAIYYDFNEKVTKIASHQILAINRGEKEKILRVKVDVDEAGIERYLRFRLIGKHTGNAVEIVQNAYDDAYKRFIGPAIEREIRSELTEMGDAQAISVFGENLYHLLMQAPLKGKIVLGFDPAYRTGCKLAVIDANGKFLDKLVIYPHKPAPKEKRAQAKQQLKNFIEKYQVEMIAIGNGTASRESEEFVADLLKEIKRPVYYVIVNEAGASVYSASPEARAAFPELHVEERSAISIGRRLQDPLAELIKIDPQAVGVGQYQHDVAQKDLREQLDNVIETAVNQVGVNLNTASAELLTHISGLTKTTAKNIVNFREENGSYGSRKELKKVPRLGPKAFEQSIGFLRIVDGNDVLDNTGIHPESYGIAKILLKELKIDLSTIGQSATDQILKNVNIEQLSHKLEVGFETLKDIVEELQKPGRDLRDEMPAPLLRSDVLTMEDLKPGMKLQGTVRNVIDFGAFVDIGVKQDGLVHISKLKKGFVKKPSDVVSVGDIVTVWVDSVDSNRHRIQLTMIPQD
ncbi:RNA-binding transcriptional accessory protein [Pediococcus stilesii]|uniref:RNA-binding transcriptional accessory protein n=1 Tax=Pediococcus stilesii TaxID=331679 RepID=A0A5R9BTN9_9LACO|nr:Tex family protein [Pediococcus stilesii]TLQ03975.1 RNA-binding transcriptional accessory protein [Pediococcus stilesii]